MASDCSRRQKEKKEKRISKKLREGDYLDTKCEYSKHCWFSTRSKNIVPITDYENKFKELIPSLEANQHKHDDIQNKEMLSNVENIGETRECSDKENKEVNSDTASEIVSKSDTYDIKHRVPSGSIKYKLKDRKKYLLDKYKIERSNRESSSNKRSKLSGEKVSTNNGNKGEVNNKISILQIPIQIDREKIKNILEIKSCEQEVKRNKISYYKSETMEADSTVSNDKKDNVHTRDDKNTNRLKDVLQHESCESITAGKFPNDFNVLITQNKSFLNAEERQRKRIRRKFRSIFDRCLTGSEEEDEESILDNCIYKRRKKNFSELSDDSTNIKSHKGLTLNQTEIQDTVSNLVVRETVTNIANCAKIDGTVCNNDVFTLQTDCDINGNVRIKEAVKPPPFDNDKQTQKNVSNESQTNTTYCISKNNSFSSEYSIKEKYVEESSKLNTSTNINKNTLPNSNINSDNCDDVNMKTIPNDAIKIMTSSEKCNSNNNDEITCHVSQIDKKLELHANSDNSDTTTKDLNVTLGSVSPVEGVTEKSKNTDNHSNVSQDDISVDTTKKNESSIVANIDFVGSEISKNTLRNSYTSERHTTDSNQQSCKQHKNVDENLTLLLQMNFNKNYRLHSNGNTISIQEDLENNMNEISSDHTANIIEETLDTPMDITLKENPNTCNVQNKDNGPIPVVSHKVQPSTSDTVDSINHIESNTSELRTLLDCNSKNIDNFKQPEIIQSNKIRVLSSAELGSRWCPTPADNITLGSRSETKDQSQATAIPINNIEQSKDSKAIPTSANHSSFKDLELNPNLSSHFIQYSLWCICKRIMNIRIIEKKYLFNYSQDTVTGNQNIMNENLMVFRYKSSVMILLEELLSLGKELKVTDFNKVIQYAVSKINRSFISSQFEPITIDEICRYVKAFKPMQSEVKTAPYTSGTSMFNNQNTSSDSLYVTPPKSVPTFSSDANEVPVTLPFTSNVHASMPHVQTTYSNSSKQNIHTPIALNQSHEYVLNLHTIPKSSSLTSHTPLVQLANKNVQAVPENRMPNTYVPHCHRILQQQPIPTVTANNVPNTNNMHSGGNMYITPPKNLHQNFQEAITSNKVEHQFHAVPLLIGQINVPQKLFQRAPLYNVPQVPQRPQGPQILMAQNALPLQSAYSPYSQNLPAGINTMTHELLFKIWDQITFCLEKNIIDCRLHERFNKACCYLSSFHNFWEPTMSALIYQKIKLPRGEPIALQSETARHIHNMILAEEKQKGTHKLYPPQNKELQNRSELMKILSKNTKSTNLASSVNVEAQNKVVQPKIVQYKSQNDTNNVGLEKQQQSHVQSIENTIVSVDDTSNILEKSNSLLVEFDRTKLCNTTTSSDKTDYIEDFNNIAIPKALKKKIKKKENTLKPNDEISFSGCVNKREENSSPKQTIEEGVCVKEKASLPKQTTGEEIVDGNKDSSPPEEIIEETGYIPEKSSSFEHTIQDTIQDDINDPHIVDVRSISPTSFNKMQDILALNDSQLPTTENTENNEIEVVKIKIPACLVCSEESKVVCEVCVDSYYCSKECAEAHWILEHHEYCKPFNSESPERFYSNVESDEDTDFNVNYVNTL